MRDDILREVTERLKSDYGMKESGDKKYLQKGRCPACKSKDSLWASALNPAILHCQRANDCGREFDVKNLYPEIFDNWSKRHPKTEAEPDAAADAYLTSARGLKIGRLKGSYSQEIYEHPARRDLRTATVRFSLPGGGYWERFIDQPGRFGKMKASFKMGSSYKGYAWTAPDQPIDKLAHADRIWITEGIFDAASWQQVGEFAVSAMSTNNYPDKFLAALKKSIADQNVVGAPLLIFAFDIGPAGERYSKKYVEQAKKEGWAATAALPAAEGETGVKDWNDLLRRDRLSKEDAESYLWNGRILLAKDAHEKAVLIWEKHEWSGFSFVHDCRTWWATFDEAKINEAVEKSDITRKAAARRCCNVTEIANCAFKVLYSQFNKTLEERHFYLSIRLPWSSKVYGAKFTPAAMTASSEFKKVLMGAGNGAMWTGSGFQLDKIVGRQMVALKEVETLDFTGYSKEHEAYVFGDIAVHNGRVIKPHEDDYFECGDALLKLRGTDRILDITFDPERFDTSFVDAIWRAFGGNGMVTLTFFIMSMFAEQIRAINKSLLFIEMCGPPGTGKTTLIELLWKLYGREGYEGLDPSTATFAAVSRNMASTANIPVVFMEGDRDDNAPHQRKFDWNPLKKIYGGKPFRETGQKNNGQETNAPPFKASLIIEQNDPVNASPAIMERIISMKFTKDGWSQDTKRAAEALEQWPTEEISGTVIHVVQREKAYLSIFREKHPIWEAAFITGTHRVRNSRIRKCAAQLHAGLDAMAPIFDLPQSMVEQVHRHINELAVARDKSLESDHPVVAQFWEAFDYLTAINEGKDPNDILGKGVNVHRKGEDTIAVNLQAFEAACRAAGISHPPIDKLKAHLGTSKSRRFVGTGTVNTRNYGHLHCWQFLSEEATERQKPTAKGK